MLPFVPPKGMFGSLKTTVHNTTLEIKFDDGFKPTPSIIPSSKTAGLQIHACHRFMPPHCIMILPNCYYKNDYISKNNDISE